MITNVLPRFLMNHSVLWSYVIERLCDCVCKTAIHTAVAFIVSTGAVRYAITYLMSGYTTSIALKVMRITRYNDNHSCLHFFLCLESMQWQINNWIVLSVKQSQTLWAWVKQEGQHPLTGQRAANFTHASVCYNVQWKRIRGIPFIQKSHNNTDTANQNAYFRPSRG